MEAKLILQISGYIVAVILLLVTCIFFGWSRALRAGVFFTALVAILCQKACNSVVEDLGWATGGAKNPYIFEQFSTYITWFLIVWGITLVIVPNWVKRKNGIIEQQRNDN